MNFKRIKSNQWSCFEGILKCKYILEWVVVIFFFTYARSATARPNDSTLQSRRLVRGDLISQRSSCIPKILGSVPTVARHIFSKLAWCGYRIQSQELPRAQALADRTTHYINSLHQVPNGGISAQRRVGCGHAHTSHLPLRAYVAMKYLM